MSPFVPQGDDGIDWGDGEKGQEGTITAEPSAQVCDTLEGPGCPQIPPDVTQCHPLFLRGMMALIGAMERRDRRGQSRFWRLGLRVSRAGQGFLGAPIIWGDAELDLGSHPCPLPPPTSQTQRDLGMGQREGFGCWGGGFWCPGVLLSWVWGPILAPLIPLDTSEGFGDVGAEQWFLGAGQEVLGAGQAFLGALGCY